MTKNEHRRIGVGLFNLVWKLMGKRKRTREEAGRMVHAAHASLYHWSEGGAPVNLVRGEWQVSRVYAVLRRAEPSLWHAERCLVICREHAIGDFDLAYAYEAMARAYGVARKARERDRYLKLARAAGGKIKQKDDREWFEKDLASVARQ